MTGIEVLRDRQALFGPVASMPTAWRLLDRIDEAHLARVRGAGDSNDDLRALATKLEDTGGGRGVQYGMAGGWRRAAG